MTRLKAGQDVDAFCSKCQLSLAHVIIALDGTRIVRVECKTCRGVHAYRESKEKASKTKRVSTASGSTTAKARSTGESSRSRSSLAHNYDKLMDGADFSRAVRYRIDTRFELGDVINHPKFGLGMVTRAMEEKVEALFPEGPKVLVHARA
jgi:hypothetical protein